MSKRGVRKTQDIKPWTEDDFEIVDNEAYSDEEAAEELGRTVTAVQVRRRRRRAKEKSPAHTSVEEDVAAKSDTYWRRQYHKLSVKYDKLVEQQSVVERLVEDIKEVAPRSYSPSPKVPARRQSSGQPQSAVLLFSDTHVGLVVSPNQTLGFGDYNFDVFLSRLKYLEQSVVSILEEHTNTQVPELVIAMLGDMLDGKLIHNAEAGQVNTVFSQFYGAGHAIAQFIRNLAPHVPKVRIHTVVGNHTRWDSQRRMPTNNRFSNLDSFLYALAEALTKDLKTVEWNLSMQPFSTFSVEGFVFHAAHGDHLRGGDKALGIPNHSVGRFISTTTQLYNKIGSDSPHYYLTGHLHRGITLPHAKGEFIVNGGFPGLDGYSLTEAFNPADPIQRFFLVHPRYGKTASYPISLKFAETTERRPYEIPERFPVT